MSAQPPREPVREREVVVTDGRRDSSSGPLMAIIAIVVVLIVGYFIFQAIAGMDFGGGGDAPAVPEDVNVDVNLPDGGEGGGG